MPVRAGTANLSLTDVTPGNVCLFAAYFAYARNHFSRFLLLFHLFDFIRHFVVPFRERERVLFLICYAAIGISPFSAAFFLASKKARID
jgi:hypothetical protein